MNRIRAFLNPPTENRAGFTDFITQAILQRSADAGDAYAGALEIAAGTISRAFASAQSMGRSADLFDPQVMMELSRDLIEKGESVWKEIDGRLVHQISYDHDMVNQILFRYTTDPATGRGIGPLGRATGLNSLLVSLEQSLSKEASGIVGYLLPIPSDGNDESIAELKSDLKSLSGQTAVVETTSGGWDSGRIASPQRDFVPRRLGPAFPENNIKLYRNVQVAVLAACGVPTEIVDETPHGTTAREAWRRFLHATLQPMGKVISIQAAEFGYDVAFNFDDLMASDVTGRARAFGSMVQGGMDITRAAQLSGLLASEED